VLRFLLLVYNSLLVGLVGVVLLGNKATVLVLSKHNTTCSEIRNQKFRAQRKGKEDSIGKGLTRLVEGVDFGRLASTLLLFPLSIGTRLSSGVVINERLVLVVFRILLVLGHLSVRPRFLEAAPH